MRVPARWVALPLFAAPLGAWALGLGEIQIQSALNQPFDAEILLEEATPEELAGLTVALASQETFERYGLDRPEFLSSLEFSVGRSADGADVVLIRSTQPIAEPFITMLVEAAWPRGRIMREYTVLLDPPLLVPAPAANVPVESAEARVPQANIREGATAPPPAVAPVPDDVPEPQAAPSTSGAAEPASASDRGGTYGPVQRGDTLWAIASRYRPDDVSLFQMLLAVYEANPEAFAGNMNHLFAGAILRIPERTEIGLIAADNARAEFVRQTDVWQQTTQQQARLRLVPPTPESQPGAAGSVVGDEPDAGELRDEVAALRSELDESRRLLDIRDEELRDLQEQLSAQTEGADEADSEQLFADETESATGAGVDADAAPVSMTRAILASPWTWIGGGSVLVLLMAFLFLRRGLRKATDFELDLEELQAELDDPGTDDESASDPQTVDDIGTRLDLARAYIDMGNADRARRVLAAVLEEGDSDQRDEARTLLDALED